MIALGQHRIAIPARADKPPRQEVVVHEAAAAQMLDDFSPRLRAYEQSWRDHAARFTIMTMRSMHQRLSKTALKMTRSKRARR